MITIERLKELLSYDPETGLLHWRVNRRGFARAGDQAGSLDRYGYVRVKLDGKEYAAARIAFVLMTGTWPDHEVDHINCQKVDNRWENLRPATRQQNAANVRSKLGPTGVRGVQRSGAKFKAVIRKDGKQIHIGTYDTVEGAKKVYDAAARELRGTYTRTD